MLLSIKNEGFGEGEGVPLLLGHGCFCFGTSRMIESLLEEKIELRRKTQGHMRIMDANGLRRGKFRYIYKFIVHSKVIMMPLSLLNEM